MKLGTIITVMATALWLASCGGGGSTTVAPSASGAPTGNAPVKTVLLSGKITYDHVPHKTSGFGLDYGRMAKVPARGVLVVLLDEKDSVIDQTRTDAEGDYSFNVAAFKDVKIQARAQLLSTGTQAWDVKVTDNTLENALYVMEGGLNSSGTSANQSRNLHAKSGWDGTRYADNRVAAPFAVLSPIYESIQAVVSEDPKIQFPGVEFRWSPNNQTISGDKALGQIGTSGYYKDENAIYLLGEANRDTDEYDPHVIIHEWGHYFEHHLSRMDSFGGLHSLNDKLDPRVAFSEGWGNALSAIITGDPEYKDSNGSDQGGGFEIDFETRNSARAGWYNEGSVAAILYDIFDDNMDGQDRMSLGFGPIYQAMTHADIRGGDVFTTIFAFSDALLQQGAVNASDYALLLDEQNISASDAHGTGEVNNGAIATSLPVYKEVSPGSGPVTICSVDDAGNYNKLGNREFVFFNIDTAGDYNLSMTQISGEDQRDPDFNLWMAGTMVFEAKSSARDSEVATTRLEPGNYVAEAYDFYNINGTSSRRGDACFEFSITL